jgi:hypothetical protein
MNSSATHSALQLRLPGYSLEPQALRGEALDRVSLVKFREIVVRNGGEESF